MNAHVKPAGHARRAPAAQGVPMHHHSRAGGEA